MDVTKAVSTAVPKPEGTKAPINQFAHVRAFPDATYTDVVSPNADTLYSLAWLDLAKEPMVLSVPEMGKRYYLMQIMDAWTNVFASPGTRTTGGGKGALRHRRAGLDGRSCPRASRNSSPRRTWSGSSVARRPTARTITRRSTPSRTSTS